MGTTPPDPAPPSANPRAEQPATDWRSEQERELYTAAGVDPGDLSDNATSIVRWLAGWDDHTILGVMELVAIARARALLDAEAEKADQ